MDDTVADTFSGTPDSATIVNPCADITQDCITTLRTCGMDQHRKATFLRRSGDRANPVKNHPIDIELDQEQIFMDMLTDLETAEEDGLEMRPLLTMFQLISSGTPYLDLLECTRFGSH
ncbi:hypothetical protein BLNAU_8506 [Blattamonas nauphoetae]|uniref:Uncharacterized protein n=1 Tax=Blattamonas nauphoetae TaxID=2049346 RepID=A0ABQ9XYA5_9EUKA|nr:hypothetical protein BLNAU_8506 [Blattamonas nauphoetae]